jgi:hypothetical protein
MPSEPRFSEPFVEAVQKAKILGVRAGSEHRYTGVWVVVVEGRVFVRSWNNAPGGWFAAFRKQPVGTMQVAGQEIAVRGRITRSERLRQAVSKAYATKYNTKASQKWVSGFTEPHRLEATLELLPVS